MIDMAVVRVVLALKVRPPGVLEFVNSVGLVAPGPRALYKVYVKLKTGNVRGSNTVSVVRE